MGEQTRHRCVLCGAMGARYDRVTLDLERDGVKITIRGIPASTCDSCGDDVFDGPLAETIGDAADQIFRAIESHARATAPSAR